MKQTIGKTSAILHSPAWNLFLLLAASFGTTLICLLLGLGMMDIELFYDYFRHPLLFLLNWIPVLTGELLLYAAINRQWAAFLINALIFILASIGDFYKLKFRSEPFLFSDLSSVAAGFGVAGNYDLTPNTRILLGIVFILLGTLVVALVGRRKILLRTRAVLVSCILLSVFPVWKLLYSSEEIYSSRAASSNHTIPGWTQQIQVSKGFIYQFLYSINDNVLMMPSGYDEVKIAKLLDSGTDTFIPDDKKVNILAFQLEAFCDLNTLGIENINEEVYKGLYKLQEEGLSGRLVTNVFAGGTVNTERSFLSGSYRMLEYRNNMETYVWYLRNQGYRTVGNHPHFESFYNRVNITKYMGFQEYWFRENRYEEMIADLPDPWRSDTILIPYVTEELLSLSETGPVFSFNVTMQGHGPYPTNEYVYDSVYWTGEQYSEETRIILNNYLGSVKETSDLLWSTAERLRNEKKPVVMIIYGDHKPWLGDGNSVYNELGIQLNITDEESLLNRFATPYVIWANDSARKLLDGELIGQGQTVSPGYLMNILFDALGWKENPVMQFTNSVMDKIPVINTDGYYLEKGRFQTELDDEGKELLQQYDGLQYYLFQHPELVQMNDVS